MTDKRWGVVALCAAVSGCASGGWPALDRAALPGPEAYPDDRAVILEDVQRVELRPGEGGQPMALKSRRRRVLVLDPKGAQAANLFGSYSTSFNRLRGARVRVSHPDGSVETFTGDDIGDHPIASKFILYQDERALRWKHEGLPAGAIVDWEVVIEDREPTWRQYREAFGSEFPVRSARFEVVVPDGWAIEHLATRAWAPIDMPPEERKIEGATEHVWRVEDLPAVRKEPSGPSFVDVVPLVSVRLVQWRQGDTVHRSFESQEDFARWMHGVQDNTTTRSAELEAVVREVIEAAGPDARARAEALYRWVQTNIRYVAVEVGIGGWRPHDALSVFQQRYGDCKDKANLLRTMLEVAGIDSHLASIYRHDGLPRRFGLPGVGNSNHAILAVELADELVFTDPTSRVVPFGALPTGDQGADVLVIDQARPRLVRTAWSAPQDNHKRLKIDLKLDDDDVSARGTAQMVARGSFDWSIRRRLVRSAAGRENKVMQTELRLRDYSAKKARFERERDAIHGTADVVLIRVGNRAGDRLLLKPVDFMISPGRRLTGNKRSQPVIFGSPITRETVVRFDLEGREVGAVPDAVDVQAPYGSYRQRWSVDDQGRLVLESRYERTATAVPAAEYPRLRAFFDEIVVARSQNVVVRPHREKQ